MIYTTYFGAAKDAKLTPLAKIIMKTIEKKRSLESFKAKALSVEKQNNLRGGWSMSEAVFLRDANGWSLSYAIYVLELSEAAA